MLRLRNLLVVSMVLVGVGQAWGAIYSLTDLGDLPGGENRSEAFAVNNSGQVAGMSSVADGSHAFLYSNGVMTDLGTLAGHYYSQAVDINDAGLAAGRSIIDETPENTSSLRPVMFSSGAVISIGSLGGNYGFANGINNSSEIVGLSSDANGVTHAFRWSNGTMTDLGSFEGSGDYSCAYGINDSSQVVGTSVFNGADRGFLWENAVMTDLGDLLGGSGRTLAFAINNSAQVVGYSGLTDGTTSQPFIWENGVMEDLGSLPGRTDWGYARGINNFGEVVGSSGGHAFAWDSVGGIRDLNSLLDGSGVGWELTHAYDINDSGQICGMGLIGGNCRAYLLNPVPEPSTISLLFASAIGLLAYGWWKRWQA